MHGGCYTPSNQETKDIVLLTPYFSMYLDRIKFRVEIHEFSTISGFYLMNPGWLKGVSTLDTQFQDGKALKALGLWWKPTWILFIKPAWRSVFSVI